MPTHTTQAIADHLDGALQGAGDIDVTGLATLADATADQLSFVVDSKYAEAWDTTHAAAVVIPADLELSDRPGKALIRVDNPELAMAYALELFAPPPPKPGVHETAYVDPTAVLGEGCVIHPRATVLAGCVLGDRVTLWPGVVIGADGFGYRPGPAGLVKMPHLGHVEIGDDVEIGANTCIDRGKFAATTIGHGTKIDDLCMIGHNCAVGEHVVMAGLAGLAGSVTLGDGVMIGGGALIRDHVSVGRGARLAAGAQVAEDVPPGETWGGSPARPIRQAIREVTALRKLPEALKQLKKVQR